jgi:hypothetical protein
VPHDHAVRPAASRTAAGVPLLALAGLVVLLGALTATIGVRPTGWLAGMAVGVTTCVLVTRPGDGPLTRADRVTLARAMLVAAVTALVVDGLFVPVPVGVLVPLTCLALVLDFVDGRVARRAGQVTARGARFDMETDAFLILVLSLHAGATLGWWWPWPCSWSLSVATSSGSCSPRWRPPRGRHRPAAGREPWTEPP